MRTNSLSFLISGPQTDGRTDRQTDGCIKSPPPLRILITVSAAPSVGQSYVRPCVSVPTTSDSTGIELYPPQPVRSIRSCHFLLAITDQTPWPCKVDAKSGRLGFLGFSYYLGVRVSPSLSCRCFCFGHIKFVAISRISVSFLQNKQSWNVYLFWIFNQQIKME